MGVHLHNPVEDGQLTEALTEVMGRLRSRQYIQVVGHLGEALQGSGDAFIDTLARHLLYEEQMLFPMLRKHDAETAKEVECLQAEHRRLRELATELAVAIKSDLPGKAYEIARTFLAELYSHIQYEAKVTDRVPECRSEP